MKAAEQYGADVIEKMERVGWFVHPDQKESKDKARSGLENTCRKTRGAEHACPALRQSIANACRDCVLNTPDVHLER